MIDILVFRQTGTVLSRINYHIVLSTRYRRKIFLNKELEKRVREIITSKSIKWGVMVYQLEIGDSYIVMKVECPPDLSAQQLVRRIKTLVSVKTLKDDFPELSKMPTLWIRGYIVSTDMLNEETIKEYVLSQKNRYK